MMTIPISYLDSLYIVVAYPVPILITESATGPGSIARFCNFSLESEGIYGRSFGRLSLMFSIATYVFYFIQCVSNLCIVCQISHLFNRNDIVHIPYHSDKGPLKPIWMALVRSILRGSFFSDWYKSRSGSH